MNNIYTMTRPERAAAYKANVPNAPFTFDCPDDTDWFKVNKAIDTVNENLKKKGRK